MRKRKTVNKPYDFVCVICEKHFTDQWGNNPWPVNNDKGAICCNACNGDAVIPMRIEQLLTQGKL